MRQIIRYLAYAFRLFKLNIGTLLVFEIIYKLALTAIFKPVLSGLMRAALRLQGLSYLSDETFFAFVKSPLTWVTLVIIVLAMAFFTLWDICCIILCFHASYRQQKIPLITLIRRGLRTSFRVIYQRRNIIMILYLLIIIPMTHAVVITGYVAEFSIPEFILEYILSHWGLRIVYIAFWAFMGLRSFGWMYSLHYFCLENCDFKKARFRSWRLIKGHYWQNLIVTVVWNVALIGAYTGIIFFGAWVISKVNQLMQNWDMFASLTLSGVSLLLEIVGAAFYCFGLPLVFLFISLMFYYRKRKRHERIAPPLENLEEAYRVGQTGWAKSLYRNRKRIIIINILVVIGVNFIYSLGDKKGFINMSLQRDVQVTAHRGYSVEYPENTIPAFKGAIEIGADWIELDVQETSDGEVVVIHDSNLKRTTGVDQNIWDVTYDEIKGLDNGSWFDMKYKATGIPTLEDVIKMTMGRIRLNIEIKPTGHEKHLEESVSDLIEKYHITDFCLVSSKKYESLQKIKEENPDIKTLYITSVSYGNFTVMEDVDGYSVESMLLDDSFVSRAHRADKEVHVWTVNSEDTLSRVIGLGVDNVITDDPVMAQKLIYEEEHVSLWDRYINSLLKIRE